MNKRKAITTKYAPPLSNGVKQIVIGGQTFANQEKHGFFYNMEVESNHQFGHKRQKPLFTPLIYTQDQDGNNQVVQKTQIHEGFHFVVVDPNCFYSPGNRENGGTTTPLGNLYASLSVIIDGQYKDQFYDDNNKPTKGFETGRIGDILSAKKHTKWQFQFEEEGYKESFSGWEVSIKDKEDPDCEESNYLGITFGQPYERAGLSHVGIDTTGLFSTVAMPMFERETPWSPPQPAAKPIKDPRSAGAGGNIHSVGYGIAKPSEKIVGRMIGISLIITVTAEELKRALKMSYQQIANMLVDPFQMA